ncbi:hypothetical protein [Phaffia rhodozyma]|uniref:Uncharacterized protein n=1 Tax=Phaffia rhodozyma TaxID=264483 RepID=A0A0F7SL90_PHARH|nr:hypothetical protein [Phaffia rhodozyma]
MSGYQTARSLPTITKNDPLFGSSTSANRLCLGFDSEPRKSAPDGQVGRKRRLISFEDGETMPTATTTASSSLSRTQTESTSYLLSFPDPFHSIPFYYATPPIKRPNQLSDPTASDTVVPNSFSSASSNSSLSNVSDFAPRTPKEIVRQVRQVRPSIEKKDDTTDTVSDWLSGMDGLDEREATAETESTRPTERPSHHSAIHQTGRGRKGGRDFW